MFPRNQKTAMAWAYPGDWQSPFKSLKIIDSSLTGFPYVAFALGCPTEGPTHILIWMDASVSQPSRDEVSATARGGTHMSRPFDDPPIREAFPWETAPRYMIRDRDRVYGIAFRSRIKAMGIEEVVTAPRSPWQSPYVERVIGSIRRECLDHVIILNERHLRAILLSYIDYYQRSRTHLALGKDTPERRSVQPAGAGKIVAFPQVGGLHHRYQRLAA